MVLVYLPTKLGDFVGKLTFTGNSLYGLDNSGVFCEDFPNETSRRRSELGISQVLLWQGTGA
jgi:hypothetical protein